MKKIIIIILQLFLMTFNLFPMGGLDDDARQKLIDMGLDPDEILANTEKRKQKPRIEYEDPLAFDIYTKFKIQYISELPFSKKTIVGGEKTIRFGKFNRKKAAYLFYNKLGVAFVNERFNTEVERLKQLSDSPNIINLYGYDPENLIIVLEYCPADLHRYIMEKRPSLRAKMQVALTLIKGLKQMHDKDLIHNDLKPENVVLSKRLNSKLIDFGFSRVTDEGGSFKSDYSVGGSVFYAAPEIIPYLDPEYEGQYIYTKASDIYALGYILRFIFSGKEHFNLPENENKMIEKKVQSEYVFKFIEKVKNGWIPDLNDNSSLFADRMNELIRDCFNPNPKDRPSIDKLYRRFTTILKELKSVEKD